jgi:CRP-like cAMP-binding protein
MDQNPDLIEFIALKLDTVMMLPEDSVCKQGEDGDELYIIGKGACIVSVMDEFKRTHIVRTIGEGTMFGEVALVAT